MLVACGRVLPQHLKDTLFRTANVYNTHKLFWTEHAAGIMYTFWQQTLGQGAPVRLCKCYGQLLKRILRVSLANQLGKTKMKFADTTTAAPKASAQ
jgi:hypothetical protein